MVTAMEMMSCPNLAVPAEVMHHIVHVESSANPFAIGVVGGQLVRQPRDLAEALATARMLDTRGYNFSLGIAQVNRTNLGRYGLDSYEKAFDTCANLAAGAHILADCYARAKGDWGNAFSCYYSGNFKTGYRDGYVRKVYASINREAAGEGAAPRAVPLVHEASVDTGATQVLPPTTVVGSTNHRVALRSIAIDTATATLVGDALAPASGISLVTQPTPGQPAAPPSSTETNTDSDQVPAMVQATPRTEPAVFIPQVRGPNDAATAMSSATGNDQVAAMLPSSPSADRADIHQEQHDAAFVF